MLISYGRIRGHWALIGARRKVQSQQAMEPRTSLSLSIAYPALSALPPRLLRLHRRLLRGGQLQPPTWRRGTSRNSTRGHDLQDGGLRRRGGRVSERDSREPCR